MHRLLKWLSLFLSERSQHFLSMGNFNIFPILSSLFAVSKNKTLNLLSSLSPMASSLPQSRSREQRSTARVSVGQTLKAWLLSGRSARRFIALVLFFAIWQVLCMIGFKFFINFQLIPSPWEVAGATIDFFTSDPWVHFRSSIVRVLVGFAIASVLGTIFPSISFNFEWL